MNEFLLSRAPSSSRAAQLISTHTGSGSSSTNKEELKLFSEWILNIKDGKIGGDNDGEIAF